MASILQIDQAARYCRWQLSNLSKDEAGATAIEYGMLAALAAAGVAGGFGVLPEILDSIFNMLAQGVSDSTAAANNG
ncbi:MAG: Flp family type IVb pilin [Alphaproteobacteria bacterium]|nr:Flp family type IVb pilin [Alphaproteobacteria bacterium]